MGATTGIEWCHHTWSPWYGCSKVSPGCEHCYAETLSHRNPGVLGVWGPKGVRVISKSWQKPLAWNKAAARAGERRRIFPSLCDPFEDRPELIEPRRRLFDLILSTPNLDWLLLTKRPENAPGMMVEAGLYATENPDLPCPQPNLWLGVSCEDQRRADERIPHLLDLPAAVRFMSGEPLLGRIYFAVGWLKNRNGFFGDVPSLEINGKVYPKRGLDWVIVGGESGANARPIHPDWVRSIRCQCQQTGVPFFFKQWGEWAPLGTASGLDPDHYYPGRDRRLSVASGTPMAEPISVFRLGKHVAGRMLDGREWSEFPTNGDSTCNS